jgi:hypothetical protein
VTQLTSALSAAGYGSRSVMTSPPERSAVPGGVACESFHRQLAHNSRPFLFPS